LNNEKQKITVILRVFEPCSISLVASEVKSNLSLGYYLVDVALTNLTAGQINFFVS
jgi:hypothetical protein